MPTGKQEVERRGVPGPDGESISLLEGATIKFAYTPVRNGSNLIAAEFEESVETEDCLARFRRRRNRKMPRPSAKSSAQAPTAMPARAPGARTLPALPVAVLVFVAEEEVTPVSEVSNVIRVAALRFGDGQ